MTETRAAFRRAGWWAIPPFALSLVGLALIFGLVAIAGTGREADEGLAARLWWMVMAGQVVLVALVVTSWLPRAGRAGLALFGLQVLGIVANLAAVRFFEL